jgi:hypothetical protein
MQRKYSSVLEMSPDCSVIEVIDYSQDDSHLILGMDALLSCPASYPESTRNIVIWGVKLTASLAPCPWYDA